MAKSDEEYGAARREIERRYRERNREVIRVRAREAQKKRWAENPEAMKAYHRAYGAKIRAKNAGIDTYEALLTLADRFWANIEKRGPDECWPWTGPMRSLDPLFAYGQFYVAPGKSIVASRGAYELTHGRLDPKLNACHSCDNPPCCNPNHLFAGDDGVNMRDKVAKGRNHKNYKSKLTCEDIEAIKKDARPLSQIVEQYGISKPYISMIRSGKRAVRHPRSE